MLRVLLDHGAEINLLNGVQETAVIRAASNGHTEAVHFLVSNGASINVENQSRALLMCAVESGDKNMVSLAIELGCSFDDCDSSGNTVLMSAAASGNEELFRFCIDQDMAVDVNAKTKEGRTLLMSAAEGRNMEIVRFLVERGASVLEIDNENQTMLMLAIYSLDTDDTSILELTQFFY